MELKEGLPASTLYDQDFYLWTQATVSALRAGQWSQVDLENVIEEIETLGRSEKRALMNRLSVLLMHLLKWKIQPRRQSNSWRLTIKEQRRQIQKLLKDSPSLKPYLESSLDECYQDSRIMAADETGLDLATFPQACPFNLEQTLQEWWPEVEC
jgi:hypothetical protein